MTKSTKSIKSPLHASRDNSGGGPAERTKRYKARDSCNIIIFYEPFLNQMWPRHSVSYLCQEYVSNEIAESIRDLMLVSIKV